MRWLSVIGVLKGPAASASRGLPSRWKGPRSDAKASPGLPARRLSGGAKLPSAATLHGTARSIDRQLLRSTSGWMTGSSSPFSTRRSSASDEGRWRVGSQPAARKSARTAATVASSGSRASSNRDRALAADRRRSAARSAAGAWAPAASSSRAQSSAQPASSRSTGKGCAPGIATSAIYSPRSGLELPRILAHRLEDLAQVEEHAEGAPPRAGEDGHQLRPATRDLDLAADQDEVSRGERAADRGEPVDDGAERLERDLLLAQLAGDPHPDEVAVGVHALAPLAPAAPLGDRRHQELRPAPVVDGEERHLAHLGRLPRGVGPGGNGGDRRAGRGSASRSLAVALGRAHRRSHSWLPTSSVR